MFNIIDIDNLITIVEITDKFLNISDVENIISLEEVNTNGS